MYLDKQPTQRLNPEIFILNRIKNEEKFKVADSYDKKMRSIGNNAYCLRISKNLK